MCMWAAPGPLATIPGWEPTYALCARMLACSVRLPLPLPCMGPSCAGALPPVGINP